MKRSRVYLYVPFVLFGSGLVAAAGCHRQASADIEADRAEARAADSSRNARAQQSRSSATQVATFTEEERSRFTRVEQMIQAKFAGVVVTQNGSNYTVQIRGSGSFASTNEPLFLVDGMSRASGDLRGISPREVERIEVMKDAAASFYGARGANGVIAITTRRTR